MSDFLLDPGDDPIDLRSLLRESATVEFKRWFREWMRQEQEWEDERRIRRLDFWEKFEDYAKAMGEKT